MHLGGGLKALQHLVTLALGRVLVRPWGTVLDQITVLIENPVEHVAPIWDHTIWQPLSLDPRVILVSSPSERRMELSWAIISFPSPMSPFFPDHRCLSRMPGKITSIFHGLFFPLLSRYSRIFLSKRQIEFLALIVPNRFTIVHTITW